MLLKATELPNWIEYRIDKENNKPNRDLPVIDNDELQRVVLRDAKDDLRWKKSITESDEPRHAMLRSASELPN